VTVRDEGRLVGLLPLCRDRLFGLRILRGNSEPGDYWDMLAVPTARPAAEAAVAGELRARRHDWDALILDQLAPGSTIAAALERVGLRVSHRSAVQCPGVTLPDSFDAYLASLPTRRRTNLRRRLRILDEGEVEMRKPGVEELPDVLKRWQALRVRQWDAMGKQLNPIQAQPRFRHLLADVTAELVPAGRADVSEFVRDGEVIASFVNFCDDRAFYQYVGAFAPEFGRLALGKVATADAIRSSIVAGRTYYDFARGNEAYKYEYGAVDRLSPTVILGSRHVRSIVAGRVGALAGLVNAVAERVRT
jgi:CelD/BcsL family acetyltransferase involved in cellulose biosynthesis